MKYILPLFLLLPVFLFAQNIGIDALNPTEKLEVIGVIYTNNGGVRFPDGTLQTTAASPNAINPSIGAKHALVLDYSSSGKTFTPTYNSMKAEGLLLLSENHEFEFIQELGGSGGGVAGELIHVEAIKCQFSRITQKAFSDSGDLLFEGIWNFLNNNENPLGF